jgi:rubrerythrin
MADLIWSCPDCGDDLDDWGGEFHCPVCDTIHAPPAVMVPDDDG